MENTIAQEYINTVGIFKLGRSSKGEGRGIGLSTVREILDIIAHAYRLDGQDNIKDPIGMTGARLEIRANVVSGLVPHITNLQKSAEMAKVEAVSVVPSVLAAAQSVLTESQRENGVAVIDFGAATTGIAICK